MRSETVTTVFDAPANEVFDYLSRIESLPEWATEFARELRFDDGEAIVVNGLGEFVFRIEADPRSGVIDMLAGPSPRRARGLPDAGRRASRSRDGLHVHDVPAAGHARRAVRRSHASLEREFENIRARFEPDRRG